MEHTRPRSEKEVTGTIPTLKPFQFDDYLFQGWKAPIGSWYNDFHIARIEDYKTHLKLPIPPHRRSVFYFFYLTEGSAIRSKLLNQYTILPEHFFFLPADVTSTFDFLAPTSTGFYCHFKKSIFLHPQLKIDLYTNFPFFRLDSEPLFKGSNPDRILQLLQILEEEYKNNHQERFGLISMYLTTLFIELNSVNPKTDQELRTTNAATHLTVRYKNALSAHIYEKTTVTEFADYLAVTSNHLNKCVKSIMGKSAQELLSEMQLLEAKVLLGQSNLSIGEISYKLGKSDQSSFSRFFKSKTDQSPNQYRKGNNFLNQTRY